MDEEAVADTMLRAAAERWGEDEAERMKPVIERISKAVRKVQEFELEPGDEPSQRLGEE